MPLLAPVTIITRPVILHENTRALISVGAARFVDVHRQCSRGPLAGVWWPGRGKALALQSMWLTKLEFGNKGQSYLLPVGLPLVEGVRTSLGRLTFGGRQGKRSWDSNHVRSSKLMRFNLNHHPDWSVTPSMSSVENTTAGSRSACRCEAAILSSCSVAGSTLNLGPPNKICFSCLLLQDSHMNLA